jgi:MFS-type transporter involved in bile tolerance (Atg22 family)
VHEWDTFAVIVGGSAGALVGLLFVAISIHAGRIAESADLRGRAAQTLVIFAALLLIALLLAIPEQSQRVLGVEFLVLAVLVAVALILLDRLARNADRPAGWPAQ